MADLTNSISIATRGLMGRMSYPIQASNHVYGGASISVDTSGRAGTLTAGERLIGICAGSQPNDNTTASAGQSGYDVEVYYSGQVLLAVSGAAAGDEGKAVFTYSDDNHYGYSPVANQYVGKVVQYEKSGYVWVELDPGNHAWQTVFSIASGGTQVLPAINAMVSAAEAVEGGTVVIDSAGACVLVGGSANFDDADTASNLCIFDDTGVPTIKNNLTTDPATVYVKWFGAQ